MLSGTISHIIDMDEEDKEEEEEKEDNEKSDSDNVTAKRGSKATFEFNCYFFINFYSKKNQIVAPPRRQSNDINISPTRRLRRYVFVFIYLLIILLLFFFFFLVSQCNRR